MQMVSRYLNIILFFALCLLFDTLGSAQEIGEGRRLFDFTPVSKDNPVLARIGDSVKIPVSEYLAYQKAEHLSTAHDKLSSAQKKEMLNDLIGEYLLVDEAYRIGADKRPGITSRMKYTRTFLLSDFLVVQEVGKKAATAEEYNKLLQNLQNRLFEAATIDVSIEAYDKLKNLAKEINALSGKTPSSAPSESVSPTSPSPSAKIGEMIEKMPDSVLARYNGTPVMVNQLAAIYSTLQLPRPRLETNEDLIVLIKPLIIPELMAAEAVKQGIEKLPDFQNKITQNQNALLRIYMHGLIKAQTNKELEVSSSDLEKKMRAWYRQNAEDYAVQTTGGAKKIPSYDEIHKRVEGDYSVDLWNRIQAEKIDGLRKARHIEINKTVLGRL